MTKKDNQLPEDKKSTENNSEENKDLNTLSYEELLQKVSDSEDEVFFDHRPKEVRTEIRLQENPFWSKQNPPTLTVNVEKASGIIKPIPAARKNKPRPKSNRIKNKINLSIFFHHP